MVPVLHGVFLILTIGHSGQYRFKIFSVSLLLGQVVRLVKEVTTGHLPFFAPLVNVVQTESIGRSYSSQGSYHEIGSISSSRSSRLSSTASSTTTTSSSTVTSRHDTSQIFLRKVLLIYIVRHAQHRNTPVIIKKVEIPVHFITVVCTISTRNFTKCPLTETALRHDINRLYFLTVIKSGKFGLLAFLVEHLNAGYHIRWQVLDGQIHVAVKEFLSVYQYFLHLLSLCLNRTAFYHDSRHLGQ